MKYIAALQALVAVATAQQLTGIDLDQGKTREQQGHKVVAGGLAPKLQDLTPRFQDYAPGAKRVKVRYGPYTLSKVSTPTVSSLLTGEKGTMSTFSVGMQKPCTGYCNLITAMADLEYANGTQADMATGAWLHHIVYVAAGTNRKDTVCGFPFERFFSSGNEKTPTAFGDITQKKVKSCFPIGPSDSFAAELELMNMADFAQTVYITVDYEFIPGPKPDGWKVAKAAWLDVTGCGISYVSTLTKDMKKPFTLKSTDWVSQYDGEMLGVGGHLHDGGVNLQIFNNKKVVCDSIAEYTKPGEAAAPMAMPAAGGKHSRRDGPHAGAHGGGASDGKPHIRQMSTCSMLGNIKKGDRIHIEANYDFPKFPGMTSTEIMGIAIMYSAMDMPSPVGGTGAAAAAAAAPKAASPAKAVAPAKAATPAKAVTPASAKSARR